MRAQSTSPAFHLPGLEPLEPRVLLCASNAITAVLASALDAWWRFDEVGVTTITDDSGSANSHTGTLNGAATVSALGLCGGAAVFTGGEMNVANHSDINLDTHTQRTVALWFNADDLNAPGRQMLYEEGGGTRGLNIYIENGQLVVGGWNRAESGWQGTWLSTDAIVAGHWHHVVLTLDGGPTTQPGALHAYLDGQLFASGEGSQLWPHSGDITLGGIGDTRFPDGSGGAAAFLGHIDDFRIYNRALSAHDIAVLSGRYNEGAAIKLATTWRDSLIPERAAPIATTQSDALNHPALAQQPESPGQGINLHATADTDPARSSAFAAPGVDEAPPTPAAAPGDQTPPPEPPATTNAPTAANDNTPLPVDSATHSADAADDEAAVTDEEPQVAEVPTDDKRHPPSPERRKDVAPKPTPASMKATLARDD
ncbi:MAG: LamG domain-containing protein [Planctomycetota bacterium]